MKTTVLQFMLVAPWPCKVLCFLLTNCEWLNKGDFSIGQEAKNGKNVGERCVRWSPKKLTLKKYNKEVWRAYNR